MTKEEQCKVPLDSNWGPNQDQMSIEKMRKEYHEYCPKSKSNNIVFCPKKIISRKKDKKVKWINDYFKNFGKKSMKEMNKKRRGKEKKSKPNTNEIVNEIKEKVNNIKDKFNNKPDDMILDVHVHVYDGHGHGGDEHGHGHGHGHGH